MEERLEKFRDKIKLDNLTIAFSCFILAVFAFLAAMGEAGIIPFFTPAAGDNHWQSMWRGFISGASFGILGVMIFFLIRNIRALYNEKFLKKLYVQENDERQIQIWTAARAESTRVFLLAGLAACIIAGYFSITVSLTILVCILVHSLLGLGFKIYYSKKY
jgi:uncharacterized membrane protein